MDVKYDLFSAEAPRGVALQVTEEEAQVGVQFMRRDHGVRTGIRVQRFLGGPSASNSASPRHPSDPRLVPGSSTR